MRTQMVLATRYLLRRRLRTALTTLAVVFGVAVIFAVNSLIPSMLSALEGTFLGVSGQVDLTVSSATGETFDPAVTDAVRRVSGVAAASPSLRRLVNVGNGGNQLELVGIDLASAQSVRRYQVTSGRFLESGDSNAALISEPLAQASGLRPGSDLPIPTLRGEVPLKVVGVVSSTVGERVIVPLATAQDLFGAPGRANTVDISIAAGADRGTVKAALEGALGPAYRVGSVVQQSDTFGTLQAAQVGLNIFGLLALFMGGFLIFNTFRTVVVERRHDLGMLRAVGATRRTIVSLILVESLLQGVVGTVLGLGLGYLFAFGTIAASDRLLEQYLRARATGVFLSPEIFALSIGLGIGVTLLAGLLPAINASRVPVMAALRPEPPSSGGFRVGKGVLAGGLLAALAVAAIVSGNSTAAGVGALLFLAALVLLAPALVRPIARLLQPALGLAFAGEARIAEGNMRRQPGRAAVTASAIMIALAIIVTLTSLLASIQRTFYDYIERSLAADVILLPPSLVLGANVGAGPALEQSLAKTPGIGVVATLEYAGSVVNGSQVEVLAFDPKVYPKVANFLFDQGGPAVLQEMDAGRVAIITPVMASTAGLRVGDALRVQTPDGITEYRVGAVAAEYLTAKINTLYISQKNMATDFHRSEDVVLMANLAPGADREQVKARIGEMLKSYPQFTLYWGADLRAEQRNTISQAFLGVSLLLVVMIIPSLLGLINTLAINVLERTREIGVLRAIGATRAQIRGLVLAEALLLGAAGALLGMFAGLALGYGLTMMVAAAMVPSMTFSFPLDGLVIAAVIALLMAVIASLLPARQAAGLRIVQALRYE